MNKKDWPKLVLDEAVAQGFLLDRTIAKAIERGQLISQGGISGGAKYACYELHIGTRVRQLVMDIQPGTSGDLYREKAIPDSGEFVIGPGETFTISAAEELQMPADIFAITIPVGNLYRLGLNPETSFADPGFTGEFYVTVCNYSVRNVKLKVGDPLARAFFFKLADRPDLIHESKPRHLPPAVEPVARPTPEELNRRGEAAVLADVLRSVSPPHYEHAFITERMLSVHRVATSEALERTQSQVALAVVLSTLTFLLAFIFVVTRIVTFVKTTWPDIFGNLVAEAIFSVGALLLGVFIFPLFIKHIVPSFRRVVGDRR